MHLFLFCSDLGNRQRSARIGATENHGQALGINPLAGFGGSNIGLILVVSRDQLNRLTQHLAAKIINGHLHGDGAIFTFHVGVKTGHVGDKTDLHFLLRLHQRAGQTGGCQHAGQYA